MITQTHWLARKRGSTTYSSQNIKAYDKCIKRYTKNCETLNSGVATWKHRGQKKLIG